jgi:hypothetical protein
MTLRRRIPRHHFGQNMHQASFSPISQPSKSLKFGFEVTLLSKDASLLSYCMFARLNCLLRLTGVDTSCLSSMITTINDSANGFRMVLLPIALYGQSLSSQSLRQSILALSATHLYGPNAAVEYKLNAIRLLSQSFESCESDTTSQLATCMMLCVTDVYTTHEVFDLHN